MKNKAQVKKNIYKFSDKYAERLSDFVAFNSIVKTLFDITESLGLHSAQQLCSLDEGYVEFLNKLREEHLNAVAGVLHQYLSELTIGLEDKSKKINFSVVEIEILDCQTSPPEQESLELGLDIRIVVLISPEFVSSNDKREGILSTYHMSLLNGLSYFTYILSSLSAQLTFSVDISYVCDYKKTLGSAVNDLCLKFNLDPKNYKTSEREALWAVEEDVVESDITSVVYDIIRSYYSGNLLAHWIKIDFDKDFANTKCYVIVDSTFLVSCDNQEIFGKERFKCLSKQSTQLLKQEAKRALVCSLGSAKNFIFNAAVEANSTNTESLELLQEMACNKEYRNIIHATFLLNLKALFDYLEVACKSIYSLASFELLYTTEIITLTDEINKKCTASFGNGTISLEGAYGVSQEKYPMKVSIRIEAVRKEDRKNKFKLYKLSEVIDLFLKSFDLVEEQTSIEIKYNGATLYDGQK